MQISRILGDRVLVSLISSTNTTRAGIVLPDRAAHLQPKHGIVRDVGHLLTTEGEYRPCLRVSPGEIVVLPPKGGMEIDSNGERLFIYDSSDVLAVAIETVQDAKSEGIGRVAPVGAVDANSR